MKRIYGDWLKRRGYDGGTIGAQLYRVARVEEHYGDLDRHFDRDACRSLVAELTYSTQDERRGRPNPSKIPFVGDVRNNLASYKSSVLWYARFRESEGASPTEAAEPFPASSRGRPAARREKPARREPREGARTLADFNLDGRAAFEAIVATSQYGTLSQAVASLTLFSHPATVRQTGGKALFPAVRNQRRVGEVDVLDGRRVLLDDNKSPTDAFLWANGLGRRGADIQFNHVYAASGDADAYTALPNICMTPAFIAKLTDGSEPIRRLLRFRSHQLYGWTPGGREAPERPEDYETLEWAAPLPAVEDVRATMKAAMATKPKDRTVLAARELGWLFGDPAAVDADPI